MMLGFLALFNSKKTHDDIFDHAELMPVEGHGRVVSFGEDSYSSSLPLVSWFISDISVPRSTL